MNKILAWVTSVSSRVIARNLEREQKKIGRGMAGGAVEPPELPPPPPLLRHSFFLLSSQIFSTNSHGNACYGGQ